MSRALGFCVRPDMRDPDIFDVSLTLGDPMSQIAQTRRHK
jgi:hypothetical protein